MKRVFAFIAAAAFSQLLMAKVELPTVFADGMVLQQKTKVAVWGKSEAGKTVKVAPSWTKTVTSVKVGESGKWSTRIATPSAGGPYTIKISDGEVLELKDVLVGEVWLALGQSNMEMPMHGNPGQPVEGAAELIIKARPELPIRMYKSSHTAALGPSDDVKGQWYRHTSEGVGQCSAVAYFFAKEVYEATGIPIGIVEANWGGSVIQAWLRRDILEKEFPEISFEKFREHTLDKSARVRRKTPSALYNGQLHPLMPFTVKGFLWYQGEGNRKLPEQYVRLQTRFVEMLRDEFQCPDAPFYYVQIAPYGYGNPDRFETGFFWEAQQSMQKTIPNCAMATTLDVGEVKLIHPRSKAPIGQRLAWFALTRDYGLTGLTPDAPEMISCTFEGGKATVKVKADVKGVNPLGVTLGGFEMAGADKVFHPALAEIELDAKTITVWSDEVPEPVSVRYCFRNWSVATVFSQWGVPMCPFRTDNWAE